MPAGKQSPNTPKLPDTSERPTAGRRKLLKSALLGGAAGAWLLAPERWTRPVIESVTLPAHAQTSLDDSGDEPDILGDGPWAGGAEGPEDLGRLQRDRSFAQRLSDFFVQPVSAGASADDPCPGIFQICINRTGTGNDIMVRIGFGFGQVDSQTVTPANNLTFTQLQFTDGGNTWKVDGQYDKILDQWTGSVNGPCPTEVITENLDVQWVASAGNLCFLDPR